ncbi:hypothetical protein J4Q44_G00362670 [Coregonus suidteri]|uniref:Death domain-containing protein n=1 Tax=Coregonus suidteri TaxID=861788 RepID=A0AAN8KS21_9TELE
MRRIWPEKGPQSPCERTDLRTAIVADHLGLSWTELAREMDFSVDEINHIRVDNPNSLTTQSFMLLKKWVSRDDESCSSSIAQVTELSQVITLHRAVWLKAQSCLAPLGCISSDRSTDWVINS